jgi:hypothetical protein
MSMICTTAFPVFITGFQFFFAPLRINAMSFLKNETHAERIRQNSLVLPGLRDTTQTVLFCRWIILIRGFSEKSAAQSKADPSP